MRWWINKTAATRVIGRIPTIHAPVAAPTEPSTVKQSEVNSSQGLSCSRREGDRQNEINQKSTTFCKR